jgi:hypothetical protein
MSSSHLPPEISEYIVDLSHNEPGTLQRCCLVCKSWIPRARKHLFHKVSFLSLKNLEAWEDIFPDPVDSPAHYARSLHIGRAQVIPAAVSEASSWIRAFSNIVRLTVYGVRFLRLYFLQLLLKSHRAVSGIRSDLFKLVCFFPLLEDLEVASHEFGKNDDNDATFRPPTSPLLTGTLELRMTRLESITHQLLELPGGIRFRKLVCTWNCEDDI